MGNLWALTQKATMRRAGRAMFTRLLNRVLGLVGLKFSVVVERMAKDPLDAMLVGRKVPTEKRDWN
jgi:hypothetical protein